MVGLNLGSFTDLGISIDRIVLGIVVGVLLLAVYEAVILVAAILATRSGRQRPPAPHTGVVHPHSR